MERIIQSKDYSYAQIQRIISQLEERYEFLQTGSIGQSCLGKRLTSLTLGNGKENILFAAAFHGSERISATVILKFVEELCEAVHNNKEYEGFLPSRIFKDKTLTVIPLVNPDGCEIARGGIGCAGQNMLFVKKISKGDTFRYNANARGVDINHNFPAGWYELKKAEQKSGIFMPAPTRYGGSSPASEPETLALIRLCEQNNFSRIFAFHTQGEVIYHRYKKYIPEAEKAASILSQISGYALEEPSGLAVGGGFKDYFIERYSKPAFTIELGKGRNPLDVSNIVPILEKIRKMLIISIMM